MPYFFDDLALNKPSFEIIYLTHGTFESTWDFFCNSPVLITKHELSNYTLSFSDDYSYKFAVIALKKGKVLGLKLNNFAGLIGRELQPNYRLGTEFSGRAKIIAAEGEFQSADKLGQAADIIAAHPVALQLRNLQVLSEIAVEKNSTIVFPNTFLSTISDISKFFDGGK